jgi:DNA (cytosine-5)-methyltransferase 1
MKPSPLVLSLFPGIGLLDRAFELEGFTVVRGPDLLWGGDVRRFTLPPGRFDGIIGGPPCQVFSVASEIAGTDKVDMIPEFVRVVNEAQPRFVVMENVRRAVGHPAVPRDWFHCVLRDWDTGGETKRTRAFFTWPMMVMEPGGRASGDPSFSVMASTAKRGRTGNPYLTDKGFLPGDLPLMEYARLQGAEEIGEQLEKHKAGRAFAVHCLGNGVPVSMGRFVARAVRAALQRAGNTSIEQISKP